MAEEINTMFSRIHAKYDIMNHLMSLDFDKGWRREAALEALMPMKSYRVLDVATGTGDLAIEVERAASENGKDVSILGSDFNKDMVAIAKEKIRRRGLGRISLEVSSAFSMPSRSDSFEVLTSGFGLRSFEFSGKGGLEDFVSEAYRVLRRNGKAVLLDMAMPDKGAQAAFFKAYSGVMKAVGSLVDKQAYDWLVETISRFDKEKLLDEMRSAGFRNVQLKSLRSGIAFIATAEK